MLHRTTWFAIPILGLVLIGSGVGWWGYNQYQQRQALALQNENQYNSNFHALANNIDWLQKELGKSMISGDSTAFQAHLRNVWRLGYAAETEVGKLPFDLMPMHNTQKFLSVVSHQTDTWMDTGASPTRADVHDKLQQMYSQAGNISQSLARIQGQVLNNQVRWQAVNEALLKNQRDNQVVDGFRRMDTATTAFVESQDSPSSLQRGKSFAMEKQPTVSQAAAIQAVRSMLNLTNTTQLKSQKTQSGAYRPEYIITGSTPSGALTATVSEDGGHVLSFNIRHMPKTGDYDFADAQNKAHQWLAVHGFPAVQLIQSNQFDGIGYFVYAPERPDKSLVISQGIAMKVALDTGSIVGYDANNYYYYPVTNVPPRKYSTAALRAKLNPNFEVGMERQVIVLDEHQHYQPAVAFYGTENHETYCVYMNANTGKELSIEQLT